MLRYYQEQILQCTKKIHIGTRRNIYYSIIRSILFVCILLIAYYAYKNHLLWGIFAICAIMFIVVFELFEKNNKNLNYYQALKKIYEGEEKSINHIQFPFSNGSEFHNMNHPYTYDLDIFGERSIFHLLNRCHTTWGRYYLAKQLSDPLNNSQAIYQRQEAIKELRQDKEFIFHLMASLLSRKKTQNTNNANLYVWIHQPNQFKLSKIMWLLIHILPVVNILLFVIAIMHSQFYLILFFFVLCQSIIFNQYEKKIKTIKKNLNVIIDDVAAFDLYAGMFKSKCFQSALLQKIKQQTMSYQKSIHRLYQMLSAFDIGDSAFGFFSNVLLLTHIKTSVKIEKWKENNQTIFATIIENIGEWELLVSLTVFYINNSNFVFPKFLDDHSKLMFDTKGMGHPLIHDNKRIVNDLIINKNNLFVITGANMAGKSTFLRTIGVNIVLAHIGAPVCAVSLQCLPISLFTSIRMTDDLDNGISYFYAEAIRIKDMLSFLEYRKNPLLIIDELFRGTNSDDRLKSSLLFLRKLTHFVHVSALIATHDLGITTLEKEYPETVKNYCFDCTNQEEKLFFDYRLKQGITRTNNAYWLLKQMQIVD